MKRGLWLGGVLSALALTAACNWAGAWYGGPAGPVNVLGTGCYVVFWAVFTFLAGGGQPAPDGLPGDGGHPFFLRRHGTAGADLAGRPGPALRRSRRRGVLRPVGLAGLDGPLCRRRRAVGAVGILGDDPAVKQGKWAMGSFRLTNPCKIPQESL